jgi:hypothetical protein
MVVEVLALRTRAEKKGGLQGNVKTAERKDAL